jgi:putative tricarboxylic transport membrane protein
LKSDQFSGLMLIAIAAYVGWENRVYPIGTLQEPGPGYLPLLLAIFLGAMGLLIALWGMKSERLSSMKWPEALRAVMILVACGLATFALERIGYRLTILVLLVFFLGAVERRRPLPVALVSLGFSLASFYVIGDLLHVPLPVSPWGF